jgi:hypothetical protein
MDIAGRDKQIMLINLAAEAGIKWVIPNGWSPDTENPALANDVPPFKAKHEPPRLIMSKGMNQITIVTGLWYDWSMALSVGFGFNFKKKELSLYDEGLTRIPTTTYKQIGRAVAALLSLPIDSDKKDGRNLESLKNRWLYMKSFSITQMDVFESILRVTGDKRENWTIKKTPAKQKYLEATKQAEERENVAMGRVRVRVGVAINHYPKAERSDV